MMGVIVKLYPALFSKFKFSVPDSDLIYSSFLTTFGESMKEITVSSAFPFVEANNDTTFLMPFRLPTAMAMIGETLVRYENSDYDYVKKLKNAKYFDPSVVYNDTINERSLSHGVVSSKYIPKFISLDEEIHNTVDRGRGITSYYTATFVRFMVSSKIKSGIWFYYDGPLVNFSLLRIGGEAGMGAGFIEHSEIVELDATLFDNGNILMSSLIPTNNIPDVFTTREKIRLFYRDGRLFVKKIRVIEEGYNIPSLDSGKIINIGSKIIYGKGVYLGIKKNL